MNVLGSRSIKDKLERAAELIEEAEETKSSHNNEALKDNFDLRMISAVLLLCCCELEALRESLSDQIERLNKALSDQ